MKVPAGGKHNRQMFVRATILCLLLTCFWCAAARGSRGPWFNGWCTRITDLQQGRTLTLILGSFQSNETWSQVYAALLVGENGRVRSEQVFLDPADVTMHRGDRLVTKLTKGDQDHNSWTLPIGSFRTNVSISTMDFLFPSGWRFSAQLKNVVPWSPEGWVVNLPTSMMPTHYFVRSLVSSTKYELDKVSGEGFAHQEMNYGRRFPVAFVWVQATTDGGRTQLLLTGGKFTISGVTAEHYILAYRSKERHWDFRSIDMHHFQSKVDACNGTLSLTALAGTRRLELMISAPAESFSENIYVPTTHGFSEKPGSSESHSALAVVRLHDRRKLGGKPEEYAIFRHAALEFGGHYNCDRVTSSNTNTASTAFVVPKKLHTKRPRVAARPQEARRSSIARPSHSLALTAASVAILGAMITLRSKKQRSLQQGIADFYDASTGVWVEIWGDHLHHGYYEDNSWRSLQQHQEAQVRMIEEILSWAEVDAPESVLDVGCGVGGSSRFLQKKYGAKVTGITLSPKQRDQAANLSMKTGQGELCSFQVADALKMPFPDNSFDLIWSLESGEHMPQKAKFMSEMHRVCKPGGRIILVTWVHRDLADGESLKPKEQRLLDRISKAYHLPEWCSISDYCTIATQDLGMTGLKTTDWTEYIAPFWSAVIQSALQPRGWWALLRGGLETFRGALVMPLMNRGYRTGTIRFGLLTGCKGHVPGSMGSSEGAAKTSSTTQSALPRVAKALNVAQRGDHCRHCLVQRKSPHSAWRRIPRGAYGQVVSSTSTTSSLAGLLKLPKTIWDFTRPHTLIGTLLSVTTVHLFAVAPVLGNMAFSWQQFLRLTLQALLPALLVNVYITGLNQIFDVEIDRQNKPYLPIPSGRLSLTSAWLVVLSSLVLAEAITMCFPPPGLPWLQFALLSSAVLGSVYSAPPLRLKRFPFLAAFSIIVVRGIVVNMGFYAFIVDALGVAGEVPVGRSILAATFFAVFGLVIALMKDVPDVLGDRANHIRSLSVRLGPAKALRLATTVLKALLVVTGCAFAVGAGAAGNLDRAGFRGVLAFAALLFLKRLRHEERKVDAENPKQVFDFYMFVWKIFYVSYVLLPLAT